MATTRRISAARTPARNCHSTIHVFGGLPTGPPKRLAVRSGRDRKHHWRTDDAPRTLFRAGSTRPRGESSTGPRSTATTRARVPARRDIAAAGAIVSEYAPGVAPTPSASRRGKASGTRRSRFGSTMRAADAVAAVKCGCRCGFAQSDEAPRGGRKQDWLQPPCVSLQPPACRSAAFRD
jgi:hypothetical protein